MAATAHYCFRVKPQRPPTDPHRLACQGRVTAPARAPLVCARVVVCRCEDSVERNERQPARNVRYVERAGGTDNRGEMVGRVRIGCAGERTRTPAWPLAARP